MLPRYYRAVGDSLQESLPALEIICFSQLLRQVEIIPACNAIFDEPFAALSDLLFLLFCLDKLARVAHRDSPCKAVRMLNLVELTLDRLAQFNLVDVAENEGGLDDLAKGFQRPIQRVLLRIGIESPENLEKSVPSVIRTHRLFSW